MLVVDEACFPLAVSEDSDGDSFFYAEALCPPADRERIVAHALLRVFLVCFVFEHLTIVLVLLKSVDEACDGHVCFFDDFGPAVIGPDHAFFEEDKVLEDEGTGGVVDVRPARECAAAGAATNLLPETGAMSPVINVKSNS